MQKLQNVPFGVWYYGTSFLIAAGIMFLVYEEAKTIDYLVLMLFTSAIFGLVFSPTVMMGVMFAVVVGIAIWEYPRFRPLRSGETRTGRIIRSPQRAAPSEPEDDQPEIERFDFSVCSYGQADCEVYSGGICMCGFPNT